PGTGARPGGYPNRRFGAPPCPKPQANRPGPGSDQLAAEHGHGPATEQDPVAGGADLDQAAAGRRLETGQLGPAETLGPERAKGAVGRPGHRVLVDAGGRGEVAGDEVVAARAVAGGGGDDPAGAKPFQAPAAGGGARPARLALELDRVVEAAPADPARRRTREALQQPGRRVDRLGRGGREVEPNGPVAGAAGGAGGGARRRRRGRPP